MEKLYVDKSILTVTLAENFLAYGVKHLEGNFAGVGDIIHISSPELPDLLTGL